MKRTVSFSTIFRALTPCLIAWTLFAPTASADSLPIAAATTSATQNSRAARNRQQFDAIWTMTRNRFYDARMRGLDWKKVGDRYRAQAVAAPDKRAFQIVVNRMLGELKASHLQYFTDDDLEFYFLQSLFSPSRITPREPMSRQTTTRIAPRRITIQSRRVWEIDPPDLVVEHIGVTGAEENISVEDTFAKNADAKNADTKNAASDDAPVAMKSKRGVFVVRAILDGSPAAKAGLRVGDRLLAVGAKPFSTVGAWRGRAGKATPLVVERAGVGRMTAWVTPVAQGPQTAFLEATRQSVRIVQSGGKKLGYIHLWCMTNPAFQAVFEDALTRRLAQTDGLILDLRDGFGGTPFGWSDILFRPAIEFRIQSRSPNAATAATAATTAAANSNPQRGAWITRTGYDKPMTLLINGGTRSSKEYFAYQIKKSGRGTLVGTRTAGAFLAADGVRIGSDGFLELPIMQLALDGNPIEGRGVAPDVLVEGTDAYSSHDTQLNRAMQVLLDKLSGK